MYVAKIKPDESKYCYTCGAQAPEVRVSIGVNYDMCTCCSEMLIEHTQNVLDVIQDD